MNLSILNSDKYNIDASAAFNHTASVSFHSSAVPLTPLNLAVNPNGTAADQLAAPFATSITPSLNALTVDHPESLPLANALIVDLAPTSTTSSERAAEIARIGAQTAHSLFHNYNTKIGDALISEMTSGQRIQTALEMALSKVGPELQQQLTALFTKENLKVLTNLAGVLGLAHLTGIGEAVDIALLGAAGIIGGVAAFNAGKQLGEAVIIANRAKTRTDLEASSTKMAQGFAKLAESGVLMPGLTKLLEEAKSLIPAFGKRLNVTLAPRSVSNTGTQVIEVASDSTAVARTSTINRAPTVTAARVETPLSPELKEQLREALNEKALTGALFRENMRATDLSHLASPADEQQLKEKLYQAINRNVIAAALQRQQSVPTDSSQITHYGYKRDNHSLLDVNPRITDQQADRINNCVHCAIATDLTISGQASAALRTAGPYAKPAGNWLLEQRYNGKFSAEMQWTGIENEMLKADHGARGIVRATLVSGDAHYFNVTNNKGQIIALDGQSGGRAELFDENLISYKGFALLRTDTPFTSGNVLTSRPK